MPHIRLIWRLTRLPIGIALIIIGVAGLFLPLLPGVGPLILGFLCVGPDSRVGLWLRRLFPASVRAALDRFRHFRHTPKPPASP
jgi:uncharacterized membrane protein YbaN (DUF454 family)